MNKHNYIIAGGAEGKARLNILSGVLHDTTKDLLQLNGLVSGSSFLDLGSGGGNVSIMASRMVGETGSVTSVDFDEQIIALAQRDAEDAGLNNISFRAASAYDIGYDAVFDISYARFLLSHLERPLDVLKKMKESTKSGGKIIVEDIQFSGHFCYPVCKAFDDYVQLYRLAAQFKGADADLGPRLFHLFQDAGISDVRFEVIQPCFNKGPGKWMGYITLEKIAEALAEQGIAETGYIRICLDELEAFTKDENTIISLPRIFRVSGTRR